MQKNKMMRKLTAGILFSFVFSFSLLAQTKGVTSVTASGETEATGKTYAVVVGISDYQDDAIPDLKYADRDANAFAQFLKSKAGGSLDDDHIKVLLNKDATLGKFAVALDWLLEVCKAGDKAIIYFSGHGDVERKTVSQPGFLLCWDAPSRVYMAGGTLGLGYLEEIINTLSSNGNVKVTMVADACHSGKLSGSQIGGAQATAANLNRQYSNEIKILSCQPNEFSLEGEQWGGGRGVFSFHLVDGLIGMADNNTDGMVSLHEISRYLEDKVIPEVEPQSQIPIVLGNKSEKLFKVDAQELANLRKSKEGELVAFVKTESRGLEDDILAKVDTSVRSKYINFKNLLNRQQFFEPANDCVDYYYRQLEHDTTLESLLGVMRRNFAAALQDDAQQVLNKFLKSELMELSLSKRTALEKYSVYPKYLDRSAELLGNDHYMYPELMARKHFFEGYILLTTNKNKNEDIGRKALSQFEKALTYSQELPHIYWAMNFAYGYSLMMPDSAEYFSEKATALVPSWQLPYANMVFLYADRYNDLERAGYFLAKMNAIDSNSLVALYSSGVFYDVMGKIKEAQQCFKKAISLDQGFIFAHNNLGNTYLNTGELELAGQHYSMAIKLDPEYPMGHSNLGIIYFLTGKPKLAEEEFLLAHKLDPFGHHYNYNLACYYSYDNQLELAYNYLESALINGWNNYNHLQADEALKALRDQSQRWNALMLKYFPEDHLKK